MAFLLKQIKWLYNEFGLASVYSTGPDAWLIIISRCSRMFAYGTNSLIMALFFAALDFSDFHIGLFMSLTLLGDMALSIFLTLIADRVGRRKVLFAGSFMMVLSGTTFALFENYWILLFAAVVGVISATGSDFGPFRAIEESTLSHLTNPKTRADVLSWYVTTAALGSSVGTEISGRIIDYLQNRDGWTLINAYHAVFWMYTGMGSLNMIFILFLSSKCDVTNEFKEVPQNEEEGTLLEEMNPDEEEDDDGEEDGDHDDGFKPAPIQSPPKPKKTMETNGKTAKKQGRFAQISRATRLIMYKLWFLLTIDSLADGMVPYTLTNYYMDQKFSVSKTTLGDITSISYLLASCSTVFAGPLSRRLGLINTMVFTHLPSSAAVLLFALPQSLPLTVLLFFIRTGLNNMDQAPRSAFIAAVVRPEERTAVMGITTMVRTLASTAGPSVTGILAGNDRFWIAFVAAGALRIAYDLGLFAMFVNMKLHQHEKDQDAGKQVADSSRRAAAGDEEELREVQKT